MKKTNFKKATQIGVTLALSVGNKINVLVEGAIISFTALSLLSMTTSLKGLLLYEELFESILALVSAVSDVISLEQEGVVVGVGTDGVPVGVGTDGVAVPVGVGTDGVPVGVGTDGVAVPVGVASGVVSGSDGVLSVPVVGCEPDGCSIWF